MSRSRRAAASSRIRRGCSSRPASRSDHRARMQRSAYEHGGHGLDGSGGGRIRGGGRRGREGYGGHLAAGDDLFEGLRPRLPSRGEAAKFRTALDVNCDNPTVALLSLEIGRIEREWVDEAKSYPRRARN